MIRPYRRRAHLARAASILALTLGAGLGAARVQEDPAPEEALQALRGVTHTVIRGPLDAGSLALLRRAVKHAQQAGHDAVVLELDTPGGAIELMWKLAKALKKASSEDLLLLAWVNDDALSAGVLVALACDKIYMSESSHIGASAPVQIGPTGPMALPDQGEVRAKMIAALRSQFRSHAERHGRPAVLAEAMIDYEVEVRQVRDGHELRLISGAEWNDARERGEAPELVRTISRSGDLLSLTAREALELGFCDGLANSLDELLQKTGYGDARPTTLLPARSERLIAWMDRFSGLLLGLGLVMAYTELKMPGFGIPGALALGIFSVLLIGNYMAGLADIPHIVMVALGAALVAVEIFLIPGTLWAGILGGVMVIGGLIMVQLGPGFGLSNALDRAILFDASFNMMLAALVAFFGVMLAGRFLPDTPLLKRIVLDPGGSAAGSAEAMPEAGEGYASLARVGAEGSARTDLRPVGKIVLEGNTDVEFEGRAAGVAIETGARVRVVEVVGGRLVVEPADKSDAGGSEA